MPDSQKSAAVLLYEIRQKILELQARHPPLTQEGLIAQYREDERQLMLVVAEEEKTQEAKEREEERRFTRGSVRRTELMALISTVAAVASAVASIVAVRCGGGG